MNKGELIKAVVQKTGFTAKDAGLAFDAVIESITEALKNGEKVQLVGFGTFEVSNRAARTGHNPSTGKSIQIAASKAPKFKAGKAFKDALNA